MWGLVKDFLFFFSSRRRHTRYWRDWSSDVCSSDLAAHGHRRPRHLILLEAGKDSVAEEDRATLGALRTALDAGELGQEGFVTSLRLGRSEERRVGEECRSRWSPYHLKKKKSRQELR